MTDNLPGTPQHRAVLHAVVSHYEDDPRVLAVIVFGSLGRGNWDRFSDLDLDVVVADDTRIAPVAEAERLCGALAPRGERAALIVPDCDDAADIVLHSLLELSIRYHPLRTTSPNIVDSMTVLSGSLHAATIIGAGEANREPDAAPLPPLSHLLDRCVRYAVGADTALRRGHPWGTVEHLHLMRGLLMGLFARTHGGVRPRQAFQAQAPAALQATLGETLPRYDAASLHAAFAAMLDLLDNHIEAFTNGQLHLTDAHRAVLRGIRTRGEDTRSGDD